MHLTSRLRQQVGAGTATVIHVQLDTQHTLYNKTVSLIVLFVQLVIIDGLLVVTHVLQDIIKVVVVQLVIVQPVTLVIINHN